MNKPLHPTAAQAWRDWRWQQTAAVRDLAGLRQHFPDLDPGDAARIAINEKSVRYQLTPYLLSLVTTTSPGRPDPNDPIWRQYVPTYEPLGEGERVGAFAENWELPEDMVNPILQHKYENRVNFRIQNRCLAYCAYCFEAKRVLDKESTVPAYREDLFQSALAYIRARSDVHEVVISGGEALTMSNTKLEHVLAEIRAIAHIRAVRIQTRSLAHNPFRIDADLASLIRKYGVTAMGVHFSHPAELTSDCRDAIERIGSAGARPLLLGQIPLLKGINDDEQILEELFMQLYSLGIKPYYFLHAMPETLGAERFRTSVKRGVELMRKLKRRISNPAMPEYVIVHAKGKHTVPLELSDTEEFKYLPGKVRFRNWRGEWCNYADLTQG